MSSFEKTAALQKSMQDIKLEALNKTLIGNYSSENLLRQKHMARLLRTVSKEVFEHVPTNESIFCSKTESGETLPPNTIAYTYLDYYQFLSATVSRVDVSLPMTYALVNLPSERSVPKLRAVLGFERLNYPIDKLSLPYSLVDIGDTQGFQAYVPEMEDQLATADPLPAEWLSVGIHDDQQGKRRQGAVNVTNFMNSAAENRDNEKLSRKLREKAMTVADFAENVVDGIRTAPVIHSHNARLELLTIEEHKEHVKPWHIGQSREDILQERLTDALWCVTVHLISGHNLDSVVDFIRRDNRSNNSLSWSIKFKLFGDTISKSLTVPRGSYAENEIKFGSMTRHYLRGPVGAIEHLFGTMEPVPIELSLRQEDPRKTQVHLLKPSLSSGAGRRLLEIPVAGTAITALNGNLSLNALQYQRYTENTVNLDCNSRIEIAELFPPYILMEVNVFMIGDGSLPAQMIMGKEVSPGVHRLIKKSKLQRMSSFKEMSS